MVVVRGLGSEVGGNNVVEGLLYQVYEQEKYLYGSHARGFLLIPILLTYGNPHVTYIHVHHSIDSKKHDHVTFLTFLRSTLFFKAPKILDDGETEEEEGVSTTTTTLWS